MCKNSPVTQKFNLKRQDASQKKRETAPKRALEQFSGLTCRFAIFIQGHHESDFISIDDLLALVRQLDDENDPL